MFTKATGCRIKLRERVCIYIMMGLSMMAFGFKINNMDMGLRIGLTEDIIKVNADFLYFRNVFIWKKTWSGKVLVGRWRLL